jgi:hypothetical protein
MGIKIIIFLFFIAYVRAHLAVHRDCFHRAHYGYLYVLRLNLVYMYDHVYYDYECESLLVYAVYDNFYDYNTHDMLEAEESYDSNRHSSNK